MPCTRPLFRWPSRIFLVRWFSLPSLAKPPCHVRSFEGGVKLCPHVWGMGRLSPHDRVPGKSRAHPSTRVWRRLLGRCYCVKLGKDPLHTNPVSVIFKRNSPANENYLGPKAPDSSPASAFGRYYTRSRPRPAACFSRLRADEMLFSTPGRWYASHGLAPIIYQHPLRCALASDLPPRSVEYARAFGNRDPYSKVAVRRPSSSERLARLSVGSRSAFFGRALCLVLRLGFPTLGSAAWNF